MKKKKKKIELIVSILLILICLPVLFLLQSKQREKWALVDKTGIETMGTVIKKRSGTTVTTAPILEYTVSFDFLYEGNYHTRYGFNISEEDYRGTFIGRKYKVKFLPEAPEKTAQIYLDEPVYSEDVNIEKERERILETYK